MIKILYATQTNNAADVSMYLSHTLQQYNFDATQFRIDEYNIQKLPQQNFVIFVISTTGNAQPPQCFKQFWKILLVKDLPSDLFQNVKFTVFGLGDSKYQIYNAMARRLDKRFYQLGGKRILQIGLGDDSSKSGYFSQFIKWMQKLLNYLKINYNQFQNHQNHSIKKTLKIERKELETWKYYDKAYLEDRQCLCKSEQGQSYRIVLSCNSIENNLICLYPPNGDKDVQFMLNYLQVDGEEIIQFKGQNISIMNLLKYKLQLRVTRLILKFMIENTTDYIHRQKLRQIINNSQLYNQYIRNSNRNIIEILQDFWTVKLQLSHIIQALIQKYPRFYSIKGKSDRTQLLVRIKINHLNHNRKTIGLTSRWFINSQINQMIFFEKKYSNIGLKKKIKKYMIVAAGVGISPFFRLFQEATDQKFIVFFACRYKHQIYFQQEFKEYVEMGKIKYLFIAISGQGQKKHLQSYINENKQIIENFLDDQSMVQMVCPSGMTKHIKQLISKIKSIQIYSQVW